MTESRWALLVGAKGAGKSTVAQRIAARLADRGLRVGGVVQEAVHEEGERVAYRARHVGHEDQGGLLLARRGAPPAGAREGALCDFCSFVFDGDAFAAAAGWVREDSAACDVVLVDEVSKLEASGGGHHDAIRDALGGRAIVVLVARADQLFALVERFGLGDALATLDAGEDTSDDAFVEALVAACR